MEIDSWVAENADKRHEDFYLTWHHREQLEAAFAEAMRRGWQPPPNTEIVYERTGSSGWRSYFVSKTVEVDGTMIDEVIGRFDPNTERPVVLIDFTHAGTRAFAALTTRIVGHKLATMLAGTVRSAPIINMPIAAVAPRSRWVTSRARPSKIATSWSRRCEPARRHSTAR